MHPEKKIDAHYKTLLPRIIASQLDMPYDVPVFLNIQGIPK